MKYKNLLIIERWLIKFNKKIALIKDKLELSIHAPELFAKILWFKLLMGKHNCRNLEALRAKKPVKNKNNFKMILICLIYNHNYRKQLLIKVF